MSKQTRRTVSMTAELTVTLRRAKRTTGLAVAEMVDQAVRQWLSAKGIAMVDRERAVAELRAERKKKREPTPFVAPEPAGDPPKARCDTSWTASEHVSGVVSL